MKLQELILAARALNEAMRTGEPARLSLSEPMSQSEFAETMIEAACELETWATDLRIAAFGLRSAASEMRPLDSSRLSELN